MSHAFHPPIREAGLAESTVCARCAEMGEQPFETLDDDNLAALVSRTRAWMRDKEFARSDSELEAMRIMEKTLVRCDHLARIAAKGATT